jgi:bifunctional DNA-binding transcriptional regulator/antitoxin component of YhaV-PrlF toxin-antitoxin module
MNLATVSAGGIITMPVEILRSLGVKSGDKILFFRNENGEIVVDSASANAQALSKAQKAFEGVAERLGYPTEDEIQAWVSEVRYGNSNGYAPSGGTANNA